MTQKDIRKFSVWAMVVTTLFITWLVFLKEELKAHGKYSSATLIKLEGNEYTYQYNFEGKQYAGRISKSFISTKYRDQVKLGDKYYIIYSTKLPKYNHIVVFDKR
jgi:hypothetical protein